MKDSTRNTMTAAEIVAFTLRTQGVTHFFGLDEPMHVVHALDPAFIRPITVRDEKHAVIMAHGYTYATGKPGACGSMSGPGATNMITGLLEAQRSSTPLIAFVHDIPAQRKGRHAASDLDHEVALSPFVKWVGRISSADEAETVTRDAFRIAATGRPGPVVVLCPTDVMKQRADCDPEAEPISSAALPRACADSREILRAIAVLAEAKRPVLIAGGGVLGSGAARQLVELAERCQAPVATTMMGRGTIADSHALSVGVMGSSTGGYLGRGRIANQIVAQADVAFIVGSRTGQVNTCDWTLPRAGTRIIHLDIDREEPGRNFETEVSLIGDARETLDALLAQCDKRSTQFASENRLQALERSRAEWRERIDPLFQSNEMPIKPERLLKAISDRVDERTLLVADASYVTGWAYSHIDNRIQGRTIISPRGTGGLGWCLPAAIGAKLADEARSVVCLAGDGGFGYVMNELETAARYGVDIAIVVFNNATLAFQRHAEQKIFGDYRQCDLLDVDHAALARALGASGERVTRPDEIDAALDRALVTDGPYLLDVQIDPDSRAPIMSLED